MQITLILIIVLYGNQHVSVVAQPSPRHDTKVESAGGFGPNFFSELYRLLTKVILDSMCRHLNPNLCNISSNEFEKFGVGLRNISLQQIVSNAIENQDFNLSNGLHTIINNEMILKPDFNPSNLLAQCNICLHFPQLSKCDQLRSTLYQDYNKCKKSISKKCVQLVDTVNSAFPVLRMKQ
ncbi:hypothetical protein GJ496_011958 [Pomphorhynchus laevis]|nr:hypothetical protein GJ496_011958 [Pomphorhynchus laevis]